MNFQFTHPIWLLLLPPVWAGVAWLTWKTHVHISPWRRWAALGVRLTISLAIVLAIAGLQWMKSREGVNVFFLIDRSDSVPSAQQEAALDYINQVGRSKKATDRGGVLVFGSEASLETTDQAQIDVPKINAVVGTERTDIGAAIRLGTAAFPETGQKRLVLITDGNENAGDALSAVLAAQPLGVSVDVVPVAVRRDNDLSVQRIGIPGRVKRDQPFEAKLFIQTDQAQEAKVRLYRNDQPLGEQDITLQAGKNLFTFPQSLGEPGFYNYSVFVQAAGDVRPENNQASSFTLVRGEPRILLISSDPEGDISLANALRASGLELQVVGISGLPASLAELQSYDSIFISNLAAGDLGEDLMNLLESAVRDFGVGLVCVGGDQAYAAGAYRGTPLDRILPVDMELDSKKVLPNGAVALVMHGMEFMNGNQIARDCALGVLDALGPQDELGVVLWDGVERWLFPLAKVGDKNAMGNMIAGMNQGDLPSFEGVMSKAYEQLKESKANLKHMLIFSDGDPAAPSDRLMRDIVDAKITTTTVLIAGHFGPETMQYIASAGNGRFYHVTNPGQLPQIFIKEAAVILKSAIFEAPFKPNLVASSELTRGIGADEYPILLGYVCTTPKSRAELPLISDKGDPVLAHWQYGLGRTVAFTSDAKAKWARTWLDWERYRQFWTQIGQWSLRRLDNADLTAEVAIDKGQGHVTVEALDSEGRYRNFLDLQTVVVSPTGERQSLRLEQTGPGRYEAKFPTREVGTYMMNLMEFNEGQLQGAMPLGTSINYSPEFDDRGPNLSLLTRLAEVSGGKVLDPDQPADNPFLHDRRKTFQPFAVWEWLLKFAVILFPLDVALRRVQIDRDEWLRATQGLRRVLFFWRPVARPAESEESLASLLARRDEVRKEHAAPELFQPKQQPVPGRGPLPGTMTSPAEPSVLTPPAAEAPKAEEEKPVTTTSRLLDAKRRAQRRRGSDGT